MQYALRTNIHPDTWRSFLPELIRFCHEAHIDEVLLSEESYEIATVLQSEEYFHRVADAYCEIVPMLKREGLIPSFYIKVSMGHYEGNLAADKVLPFTKFTGDSLKPAPTTPCAMDGNWRAYIARVCADCARAGFTRMYLDDDFRSVNHNEGETGCFCHLHVSGTAARCGIPLTAEKLKAHLCGNSPEDLRVRRAWMEVNFESQLETGRAVEKAVHAVDPKLQIGLMLCGDGSSCVQGRDLMLLLNTFAGEGNVPPVRPGGGAYEDTTLDGINDMYLSTARSMSVYAGECFPVSEVDSYPRSVLSKSAHITDLHIQLHALTGCRQATLNLFDHFETPFSYCGEYTEMLKTRRALYDSVSALREGRTPQGVHFLWKQQVSETIENRSGSVRGLFPYSTIPDPSYVMARLGVPVAYGEGEVNFLDGDMVTALTKEEIARLLTKPLFLDKFAAVRLCEMGFGADIGLANPRLYEEACYECFDADGFDGGCHGQYVAAYGKNVRDERNKPVLFDPVPSVKAASHFIGLDKRPFAPATYLYENRFGARICVFAAGIVPGRNWLYKCRAGQVQAILKWMMHDADTFAATGCNNVMPVVLKGADGYVVALVNSSLDDACVTPDSKRSFADALTGEPVKEVRVPAVSVRYLKER